MLKHSIRKPLGVLGVLSRFQQRNQMRLAAPEPKMPISKVDFIKFLTDEVYPRYKVGDYVTNSYCSVIKNSLPHQIWEIKYINELYHEITYDTYHKQPNVLHLKRYGNVYFPDENSIRCPKSMRKLTDEEVQLVQLQNQKAQGNA